MLTLFIESEQRVRANKLRLHGLSSYFTDLVIGEQITSDEDLLLEPYRFVWLEAIQEPKT